MSTASLQTPRQLLDAAYRDLGLISGDLLHTASTPANGLSDDQWRSKGEWLMLGERLGAERIFFVEDDPVVVFSALSRGADERDIVEMYRRAWSMGRANCLFIAVEGELRVYALNQPPPRTLQDQNIVNPLKTISRAADVADALAAYHRESLETGLVFENREFLARTGRADERLLDDVAAATDALENTGLPRRAAHALIERVILVRYLEDRKVIGTDYFRDVAMRSEAWLQALDQPSMMPSLGAESTFVSCLSDQRLTYSIFEKLARTFNGDMFIVENVERTNVRPEHLILVQRMLTGAGLDEKQPLFLWAYDFGVIPTSLISSMYEQFYQAGTDDDSGTHYTPPELAEYVVAQTLTPKVLSRNPRICDPACGSGIFLVEAFRRLVRDEMARTRGRLSSQRLRSILLNRIAGIDINPEAVRLAAFSLYLAYLNYQDPPDINAAGRLPRLIYRRGYTPKQVVLVVADAFAPFLSNTLPGLESLTAFSDSKQIDAAQDLPWREGAFDVVVGNPPWDEPRGIPPTAADVWGRSNGLEVGDRSRSQLFMWRALSFLKPDGIAALLIAATPFHNVRSRKFRIQWLSTVDLVSIVDFTAARRMFFRGGSAPFALVIFSPNTPGEASERFTYRNVRPSRVLDSSRSMAYARTERRWVSQQALLHRDYLWKTYAWGGHRDAALMARFDAEKQLDEIVSNDPAPGWGYQYSHGKGMKKKEASAYLKSIPSLSTFEIWGPIQPEWFEDPPEFLGRWPDERRYSGQRLLITEGVRAGFGPYARLVTGHYSFRHKIYCVPLSDFPEWQAKTILAIFLSSLGRYRLFMRSGSWGLWHDKVNAEDVKSMPIRFSEYRSDVTRRIVKAIDQLSTVDLQPGVEESIFGESLFSEKTLDNTDVGYPAPSLPEVLDSINTAVFDLFDLAPGERDLIEDFHTYTLDIAGNWRRSPGLESMQLPSLTAGTIRNVREVDSHPMREYLDRFLSEWNQTLEPNGEFSWQVVGATNSELIGAVFETRDEVAGESTARLSDWQTLLERLAASWSHPTTATLGTEGVLRSVSDTSIVVIKRREARLWSASAAREDVEATMLQAMMLQET